MKTQKQTKGHSALQEVPEFIKVRQAVVDYKTISERFEE